MAEVVVYTRSLCGFCSAVKNLLNMKNVTFKELDGTYDTKIRQEMMDRSGRTTFPQVFVDGKHIGDCDEVHSLDDAGKLDALLA
ncbi:MAG: glutaredoxin 3 [Nitratireductor sp.]